MVSSAVPRALVYVRVSTFEQVHGSSLVTQLDQCMLLLETHSWQLAGVFRDVGVSGAEATRPGLNSLVAAVAAGEIDVVVVATLDRLARSVEVLSELVEEWNRVGVGLVSVSEGFDSTSPTGRLALNMLGGFGAHEREVVRDRLASGLGAALRRDGWPGGVAPFGWRAARDPDGVVRLALDPGEAETIRRAWQLVVVQRLSSSKAARILNDEGRSPRGRRGRPSSFRWTRQSLRLALRASDHWAGTWTFRRHSDVGNQVTIRIPAVITTSELRRLQTRLADTVPAGAASRSMLSGRVRCVHGLQVRVVRRAGRRIYTCSAKARDVAEPTTICRSCDADWLDSFVVDQLQSMLADQTRVITAITAAARPPGHDDAVESSVMTRQRVKRLQRQLGDMLVNCVLACMSVNEIERATAEAQAELENAKRHHRATLAREANLRRAADQARRVSAAVTARVESSCDDAGGQRQLAAMLDITAQICRWEICSDCPPGIDRHARSPTQGSATACMSCRGEGWRAVLEITGILPDPDAGVGQVTALPFLLHPDTR